MTADPVAIYREIITLLEAAGLPTYLEPAHDVPSGPDGRVIQFASIPVNAGTERHRAGGRPHDRVESVLVRAVGPTGWDALAVAQKIRDTLAGIRLEAAGPGAGRLNEGDWSNAEALPEPDTDPLRVSVPVFFRFVSKGAP